MSIRVVCLAQPSKKGPTKTVKVFCAKCKTQLYKYRKGGTGALVKCWQERIVEVCATHTTFCEGVCGEDYTDGDLHCPKCRSEFARPAMIRGRPANKIIGGKVIMRK